MVDMYRGSYVLDKVFGVCDGAVLVIIVMSNLTTLGLVCQHILRDPLYSHQTVTQRTQVVKSKLH